MKANTILEEVNFILDNYYVSLDELGATYVEILDGLIRFLNDHTKQVRAAMRNKSIEDLQEAVADTVNTKVPGKVDLLHQALTGVPMFTDNAITEISDYINKCLQEDIQTTGITIQKAMDEAYDTMETYLRTDPTSIFMEKMSIYTKSYESLTSAAATYLEAAELALYKIEKTQEVFDLRNTLIRVMINETRTSIKRYIEDFQNYYPHVLETIPIKFDQIRTYTKF